MEALLVTAVAVVTIPIVLILWTWGVIAALRDLGIHLPLSFAVHAYPRRKRELQAALRGASAETYIFVSGFLLFACPFFLALTAYEFLSDRFIRHSTYSRFDVSWLVGSLLIWAALGAWSGVSDWKKSKEREIDHAS